LALGKRGEGQKGGNCRASLIESFPCLLTKTTVGRKGGKKKPCEGNKWATDPD